MSRWNWHKWLYLSLLGLALSARTIGCDYSSVTEKFGAEAVARCNEKCPFQGRSSVARHALMRVRTTEAIRQCPAAIINKNYCNRTGLYGK
ncbi:hypothetical protein KGM_209181 [Danaus plexippus plexippus]|uniref:Secreted protein n=1 Tax=Danaus plexippus plexippus TaxID=278856 RepID=A0A212FE77_DANPL|nr:hypothetical protein KGM_209181 [Danaus plexippus plexippus]